VIETLKLFGFNLVDHTVGLIYAMYRLQDSRGCEVTDPTIIESHVGIQTSTSWWCGLGKMPSFIYNRNIIAMST
jgi:hypothetical protein